MLRLLLLAEFNTFFKLKHSLGFVLGSRALAASCLLLRIWAVLIHCLVFAVLAWQ